MLVGAPKVRQHKMNNLIWPKTVDGEYVEIATRRSLIVICCFGGLIGLGFAVRAAILLLDTHLHHVFFLTVTSCVYLISPLIISRAKRTHGPMLFYGVLGYTMMMGSALFGDGLTAPQTILALGLVLTFSMAFGWKAGVINLVVLFLFCIGIAYSAGVFDISRIRTEELTQTIAVMLICLLATAGLIVVSAGIFRQQMNEATEKLRETGVAAEAASRAKSEFLANMSHEIRTPMNGVLGMAELLRETDLEEKQAAYADTIYKSGSALLTVINDILDFSKIEAGKLELAHAPFDLLCLLEDIADLLGVSARQKGLDVAVRIAPDVPNILVGDEGRLRQVLTNLLGNAIKFTHEGFVGIVVTGALVGDNKVALNISVVDSGIGITPDKLGSIFDQFTQVDGATTRKYGGTGLGLAISKSLVEVMGGQIFATSKPGKGSSFLTSLELPIGRLSDLCSSDACIDLGDKHILVVDDLELNRLLLEENIKKWNGKVSHANNAAEALSCLAESKATGVPFAATIIDYHMPEENGLTLVKKIKESKDFSNLPVIILSSDDGRESTAAFNSLGIGEVLTKPARATSINLALARAISECNINALKKTIDNQNATKGDSDFRDASVRKGNATTRLLVAEDNVVNRMVVAAMLDDENFEIQFAEDGIEAVNMFKSENFSCILMDISMPQLDGVEAAAKIRHHEHNQGTRRTPILALTAHAMEGDRQHLLSTDFDDYLSKPVKKESLLARLDYWLGGSSVTEPGERKGGASTA